MCDEPKCACSRHPSRNFAFQVLCPLCSSLFKITSWADSVPASPGISFNYEILVLANSTTCTSSSKPLIPLLLPKEVALCKLFFGLYLQEFFQVTNSRESVRSSSILWIRKAGKLTVFSGFTSFFTGLASRIFSHYNMCRSCHFKGISKEWSLKEKPSLVESARSETYLEFFNLFATLLDSL